MKKAGFKFMGVNIKQRKWRKIYWRNGNTWTEEVQRGKGVSFGGDEKIQIDDGTIKLLVPTHQTGDRFHAGLHKPELENKKTIDRHDKN